MSDGQQPLPFGGLPSRSPATAAAKPLGSGLPRRASAAARTARQSWNKLAIAALPVSFVVSVGGLVLGILALRQLRVRNERGRRLALASLFVSAIGIAVGVALFAVYLFGGMSLVTNMTTLGSAPKETSAAAPQQQAFTEAEKAEAKAAVASGGGAIPGHIVSGELCQALGAFESVSKDKSVVSNVDPAVLASMATLAAVPSPNQPVYERMVGLAKDPAAITSIVEAQKRSADFANAIQVDITTCG